MKLITLITVITIITISQLQPRVTDPLPTARLPWTPNRFSSRSTTSRAHRGREAFTLSTTAASTRVARSLTSSVDSSSTNRRVLIHCSIQFSGLITLHSGRPVQSNTIRLLWEAFSHAVVNARIIFVSKYPPLSIAMYLFILEQCSVKQIVQCVIWQHRIRAWEHLTRYSFI